MTIESIARPVPLSADSFQLVRDWEPVGAFRAGVVLVHGLGEHSGRYARTGSILAEAGFRVRSFDLLGFGASSGRRADCRSWSTFLDQIEGHVEEVRRLGKPLVLLGHSMGGLLALEYALADRPQPDLLVLSAPALEGGESWQRAVAPILAKVLPGLRVPNRIRGDQLSRDPEVGKAYFADPLVFTSSTTRLGAEIFAAFARVRAHLDGLRLPTLVVHGGADTVVPAQGSLPLQRVAGVERRLYPSLRHELFNEPEGPQVLAEVVTWVDSQIPSEG
jgi:alpha-beta hydrolase superfamily lysophospholipase